MATAAEIVAIIDECILARVNGNCVKEYMIGNRRITRDTIPELRELRAKYAKLAAGAARGADVTYVKFTRPG